MKKHYFVKWLLICFSIGVLSSCSSSGGVEEEPAELVKLKGNVKVNLLWKRKFGSNKKDALLKLAPAVDNGELYTTDNKGRIYKLNSQSGKELWKVKTKRDITSPLVIKNDKVIFGTRDGRIFAVSKKNGNVIWTENLSSEILARPASGGDVVVVRTNDGKIYGVNSNTGKYFWVYERKVPALSLRGTGSPVVYRNSLYVGFDSGKLISLSLDAGKVKWESTLAQPTGRSDLERMVDIDADPLVDGDVVYAVSFQGKIAAMDKDTGRNKWSRDMSSFSGMAVDDRFVFVSDAGGNVWALDRNNGASFWKQDKLKARGLTAPVVYKDYVVVGDYEGYLHFLSRKDGELKGRVQVDDSPIKVNPQVNNRNILARTVSGVLGVYSVN